MSKKFQPVPFPPIESKLPGEVVPMPTLPFGLIVSAVAEDVANVELDEVAR